jgi:hypothetical protein
MTQNTILTSITIANTGTWSGDTAPQPERNYGAGSLTTYEHPRVGTFDKYQIADDAPVYRFDLLDYEDAAHLVISGPMRSERTPQGVIDAIYSIRPIDTTKPFYGAGSFTTLHPADYARMAREQFGLITQTFAEYVASLS